MEQKNWYKNSLYSNQVVLPGGACLSLHNTTDWLTDLPVIHSLNLLNLLNLLNFDLNVSKIKDNKHNIKIYQSHEQRAD